MLEQACLNGAREDRKRWSGRWWGAGGDSATGQREDITAPNRVVPLKNRHYRRTFTGFGADDSYVCVADIYDAGKRGLLLDITYGATASDPEIPKPQNARQAREGESQERSAHLASLSGPHKIGRLATRQLSCKVPLAAGAWANALSMRSAPSAHSAASLEVPQFLPWAGNSAKRPRSFTKRGWLPGRRQPRRVFEWWCLAAAAFPRSAALATTPARRS